MIILYFYIVDSIVSKGYTVKPEILTNLANRGQIAMFRETSGHTTSDVLLGREAMLSDLLEV